MVATAYPATDLDRPSKLFGLLGSFWVDGYAADNFPQEYVTYLLSLWRQILVEVEEAANCLGRQTTPVFHQKLWFPFLLDSRQRRTAAIRRYGQGSRYGAGQIYTESTEEAVYPLPKGLKYAEVLCDRPVRPNKTWFSGIDFEWDNSQNCIRFEKDPLTHPRVYKQTHLDEKGNSFLVANIWLQKSYWDREYSYKKWGYPWGYFQGSSQAYKELINAVWDAAVRGTSLQDILAFLAAVLDAPLAKEKELVVDIFYDRRGLCVVTDKRVYRYGKSAKAVVAVGDRVKKNQPLSDAVLPYFCQQGGVPEWLAGLEYPKELLGTGYRAGIVFNNREEKTSISKDAAGRTVFTFPLGGLEEDVAQFWAQAHSRGVQAGYTWANCLDARENKVGEPSADALPATINPAKFLIGNVLRNHGFIVRLKPSCGGEDALALTSLYLLRSILPRHILLFFIVELELSTENYNLTPNEDVSFLGLPAGEMPEEKYTLTADNWIFAGEPACF